MSRTHITVFLRRVLIADAASCLLMAAILLAAAGAVEQLLAIPAVVARGAGLVLLAFAALVGYVGTRAQPARAALWAIVAANALWAIESVLALAAGWLEPNALGTGFVLAQAAAVAVIAELQLIGVRRAMSTAVAA